MGDNMKKKTNEFKCLKGVYAIIFSFIVLFSISVAHAQEDFTQNRNNMIDQQYEASDIRHFQNISKMALDAETREVIPDFNIEKITRDLTRGTMDFNLNTMAERIIRMFMKEVYINISIMIQIIVLTVICGILTNLQDSFKNNGVSEVAFFACYIFLIGIMLRSFMYAIDIGRNAIENMVMFMQAMVPMLVTLMVSTGNISSATIFQPAVLFCAQFIGTAIKYYLIPIVFFTTALAIANNISDQFHVTKMVDFLKQITKWSIGIMLTIFIGVISVQGFAASVVDGVASKTIKYAVGNFIPIVGGILADAVDMVMGCSLILKNAVGIVGLITVIVICMVPIIKIVAIIAIYRFTAAIIEPVSDKRIVKCITELGNSITTVFSMVLTVMVMFILSITIILGAGNVAAMVR